MSAKHSDEHQGNEFSRPLDVGHVSVQGHTVEIEAGEKERSRLAARLGLEGLNRLSASLDISRRAGDTVIVAGEFQADVVQMCVVSLEPFEASLSERFDVLFAPEAGGLYDADEVLPLDDEEWREPIVDGRIDLGEAVVQQLSVALDPHPRAPGVELEETSFGADDEAGEPDNPFRSLASLTGHERKR